MALPALTPTRLRASPSQPEGPPAPTPLSTCSFSLSPQNRPSPTARHAPGEAGKGSWSRGAQPSSGEGKIPTTRSAGFLLGPPALRSADPVLRPRRRLKRGHCQSRAGGLCSKCVVVGVFSWGQTQFAARDSMKRKKNKAPSLPSHILRKTIVKGFTYASVSSPKISPSSSPFVSTPPEHWFLRHVLGPRAVSWPEFVAGKEGRQDPARKAEQPLPAEGQTPQGGRLPPPSTLLLPAGFLSPTEV